MKAVSAVKESTNTTSSVAAITVDHAMQRAMVEMGLRVMTTRADRHYGRNGNEAAQFMFRCYGCFNMEHDTTRTHCRTCGGMTFQRVSVYMDEDNHPHYHYSSQDRFMGGYMERHNLVPKGSQLVKYRQTNARGRRSLNHAPRGGAAGTGRRRRKKRGFIGQQQNGYRRGGGQRMW